jgi:large subunit ribosomal protein L12
MEYVYAALMLHSAGKEISEGAVKKVVEAAGATPDEVRIKALVAALEGVDISKVLSQAAAMPVAAVAPAAAAAPAEAKAPAKEEAKEEKKEEAEESGIEGLGALFG